MCGFKILSLAVTKVLVAGRLLSAKADHMPARAPTQCIAKPPRGPKLGKSQSKQNEKAQSDIFWYSVAAGSIQFYKKQ